MSIDGLVADPEVMAALGAAAKLFLAGDEDPNGAAASAQTLYDESSQPKQLEILTTSDHGTDLLEGNQGERVRTLLQDWLTRILPVNGGSSAP